MRQGPLSDAQLQERLRVFQNAREIERREDVRELMSHPWGRRLAYWLVYELGGLHGEAFAAEIKHGAEQHTAYRLGRQSLARSFLTAAQEIAPQDYLAMMAEQIRARQADLALEQRDDESAGDALE